MPIITTTEPAGCFAIFLVTDPYDIDEWRAAMLEVLSNPGFRARSALLVDRRLASPPSVEFVDAMMTFFAAHRQPLDISKAAIVVRDDAGFGMARMTELKSQMDLPHATIHVFKDYDVAVRWLLAAGSRAPHNAGAFGHRADT